MSGPRGIVNRALNAGKIKSFLSMKGNTYYTKIYS
jgi:hypothetical protein